ncbi:MAG: shikimate dehydrogenase [Acidobacteriota bacterium]|nr:shikimate dehydrogenase [Acidobacteriota bacterium]
MNNGKICVSVCAETADETIKQIKRAEELADIIEIRFDCLNPNEIRQVWNSPVSDKEEICTFRPKEQGGKRNLSKNERLEFWQSGNVTDWVDFEMDLYEMNAVWNHRNIICSHHDFTGVTENLDKVYDKMKAANAQLNNANNDVLKIAVFADDITDSLTVWKLLERTKKDNTEIIPIAMGEAGKWTRILGLAHGAFMTYASLDSGQETAPGQISVKDLIEVYRAKELDETTEVYGILGSSTSVSMSPFIHNAAFKFHNLNAVFVPLQVQNLDEFMRRMVKPETREVELNFKGFAVTIPHKQNIIKHIDFLDETAEKIGAVNTVKIVNGKLHGYNTDAHGFIEPLKNSYGDLSKAKVAVCGAGGAARACVYALKKEGAEVTIFARDAEKAKSFAEEFDTKLKKLSTPHSPLSTYKDFDIFVNTTPLGMKGKAEGETPAAAEQLKDLHLVYDLVYIPFQTRLMQEADKANVPKIGGLAMLIAQAMKQQKIWTGLDAPMKEMSRAVLEKLS